MKLLKFSAILALNAILLAFILASVTGAVPTAIVSIQESKKGIDYSLKGEPWQNQANQSGYLAGIYLINQNSSIQQITVRYI